VENNYGYKPAVLSTTAGNTTEPGLAAIETEDCSLRWSNDEIHIPSLVSKATTVGGLVLTYTKPSSALGVDAWYFTAVDARTGRGVLDPSGWARAHRSTTTTRPAYLIAATGDMFVGTLNGLVVLRSVE
jgi:hypothetical protein